MKKNLNSIWQKHFLFTTKSQNYLIFKIFTGIKYLKFDLCMNNFKQYLINIYFLLARPFLYIHNNFLIQIKKN
jgi:hypothetical protein